jgi:hypothetical protein
MILDDDTWALVVGIEKYDFDSPVPGAANAAVQFAKLLCDRGVKPGQIHLRLSPNPPDDDVPDVAQGVRRGDATFVAMRNLLEHELLGAKGQMLCVFWAGHGAVDGSSRRLYLADSMAAGWTFDFEKLLWLLGGGELSGDRRYDFAQQLIFVDACANDPGVSGIHKNGWGFNMDSNRKAVPRAGQFAFFAASRGQTADFTKGDGVYSRELIRLLRADPSPQSVEALQELLHKHFKSAGATQQPSYYFRWNGQGADEWDPEVSLVTARARPSLVDPGWFSTYAAHLETKLAEKLGVVALAPAADGAAAGDPLLDVLIEPRPSPVESIGPTTLRAVIAEPSTRVLLLGEGGAGKSTLLMRLAADVARAAASEPASPLPIVVELNKFDSRDRSLDALIALAAGQAFLDEDTLRKLWRGADRERPILLLFDGLNEVSSDFVSSSIRALTAIMEGKDHRIVVTARQGTAADELASQCHNVRVFETRPLDDTQVVQMLTDWGVLAQDQIPSGWLWAMARNPLRLMALAKFAERRRDLPSSLGELHRAPGGGCDRPRVPQAAGGAANAFQLREGEESDPCCGGAADVRGGHNPIAEQP